MNLFYFKTTRQPDNNQYNLYWVDRENIGNMELFNLFIHADKTDLKSTVYFIQGEWINRWADRRGEQDE